MITNISLKTLIFGMMGTAMFSNGLFNIFIKHDVAFEFTWIPFFVGILALLVTILELLDVKRNTIHKPKLFVSRKVFFSGMFGVPMFEVGLDNIVNESHSYIFLSWFFVLIGIFFMSFAINKIITIIKIYNNPLNG